MSVFDDMGEGGWEATGVAAGTTAAETWGPEPRGAVRSSDSVPRGVSGKARMVPSVLPGLGRRIFFPFPSPASGSRIYYPPSRSWIVLVVDRADVPRRLLGGR